MPVFHVFRIGKVLWSTTIRPSSSAGLFEIDATSAEGAQVRAVISDPGIESVREAVEAADAVEWVDPRGRPWTFRRGTDRARRGSSRMREVGVLLRGSPVGTVRVPDGRSLAGFDASRFMHLVFSLPRDEGSGDVSEVEDRAS